jgi:hypothetical protein
MKDAKYLLVSAEVRYWEDARVNGVEDVDGSLVPHRSQDGKAWEPIIRLEDGQILEWPQGTTARIHYKVCDAGLYYLLNEGKEQIARWRGDYVPDDFLCHGDIGYGDYIIFKVSEDGKIENWRCPEITVDEWQPYTTVDA